MESIFYFLLVILFIFILFLHFNKKEDTLDYSGTYCISRNDHQLIIDQTDSDVNFELTTDDGLFNGTGTASGNVIELFGEYEGQPYSITLTFDSSGDSFDGTLVYGTETMDYDGVKGTCMEYPTGDPELITPYLSLSDMSHIQQGFDPTGIGPWGGPHVGIDFVPTDNLKPFQSMTSGKVTEIKAKRHPENNCWMVSVMVKYNKEWKFMYVFENLTKEDSDRDIQLANISVTESQIIEAGDIIGYLHIVPPTYYHVHISFYHHGNEVCPIDYFRTDVRSEIMGLFESAYPDPSYRICYP